MASDMVAMYYFLSLSLSLPFSASLWKDYRLRVEIKIIDLTKLIRAYPAVCYQQRGSVILCRFCFTFFDGMKGRERERGNAHTHTHTEHSGFPSPDPVDIEMDRVQRHKCDPLSRFYRFYRFLIHELC